MDETSGWDEDSLDLPAVTLTQASGLYWILDLGIATAKLNLDKLDDPEIKDALKLSINQAEWYKKEIGEVILELENSTQKPNDKPQWGIDLGK